MVRTRAYRLSSTRDLFLPSNIMSRMSPVIVSGGDLVTNLKEVLDRRMMVSPIPDSMFNHAAQHS